MDNTLLEQARSLSVDEQLALIEALWDGLVLQGETPLPTPAQLAELERRVADHEANPDDVVPWDQVQAEVRSRLNR
jgi:putative addiction module component (TIGR02574 family)